MIIIHAGFKVNAEKENDFLNEIRSLVAASRAESGNISYDLMKDTEQDGAYTMVEVWESDEAVAAHNSSEHFTSFVGKAPQFMAAPLQVKMFNGKPLEK
ncbi:putative quinol monooxygenase [Metabacillus hrfriensis]|uniref:Quinol monooxygenase n=1 Tax=Metabacillus hrfriensis TaxID=3048891 RepID=A0ACD4R6N4_9BACI|nr:putative quinol monooxygenase [Metabacillus sp. CT-WN-B3]WHZ56129.1 putative quinol monooxygenase [Metabacillus sp. CT-WN-B3]